MSYLVAGNEMAETVTAHQLNVGCSIARIDVPSARIDTIGKVKMVGIPPEHRPRAAVEIVTYRRRDPAAHDDSLPAFIQKRTRGAFGAIARTRAATARWLKRAEIRLSLLVVHEKGHLRGYGVNWP